METYGEIRSSDAKASYDARAAKLATPRVPSPPNSPKLVDNGFGSTRPGGGVRIPEQRYVHAKKQSSQEAMGCLLLILVIVIVIIAVWFTPPTAAPVALAVPP
jgi:hypothetical protein